MKQILFIVGMFIIGFTQAQRVNITANASLSASCVVGNSKYNVTESIYTNAEIGSSNFISIGTAIEKISLLVAAVPAAPLNVVDSVRIYFKDVAPATTTFPFSASYSTAGYRQVFNGTINPTLVGFYEITLDTTYARSFGTNLQVLIERKNDSLQPGFVWFTANGNSINNVAFSSRVYNGTAEPVSGVTTLTQTFKRPAIQFFHGFAIDAGIKEILSPLSTCHNTAQEIGVVITNDGINPINPGSVQVTLKVGGPNTFSGARTNTTTLNSGQTETITFTGVSIENAGENLDTAFITLVGDGSSYNDTLRSSNFTARTIPYTVTGADTTLNILEDAESNLLTAFPFVQLVSGTAQLWTITDAYSNDLMTLNSFVGSSGSKFYLFDTQFGDNQIETDGFVSRLYSNCMDLPPASSTRKTYLTFNMTHDANLPDFDDSLYVGISDTRGETWTLLGAYGRADVTLPDFDPVWKTEEIEIPAAFEGKVVQLGFKGVSHWGNVIGLDDINILTRPNAVKVLTFEAYRGNGNTATLQWQTTGEKDVNSYAVERSVDGKSWVTIGEVSANRTISTNNYSYIDKGMMRGNNYYRLRILSSNAKTEYSSVRMIRMADNTEMVISPNPIVNNLSVFFESEKNEQITIYVSDMSGKVLLTQKASVTQGGSRFDIPSDKLSKGTYIVSTSLNGIRLVKKAVKL